MHVTRSVAALRKAVHRGVHPVGFVPTMGALHAGHCSLVERARGDCATVVASIFVNPTQFGPDEDFARYPHDEAGDLALLDAAGCDIVFLPAVADVYPSSDATRVHVSGLTEVLEGARRPGHFDGVTTVVSRLFNIVQPDRAYFGQKDAQQLLVIERMVRDLHIPVEVVRCPTVRAEDGLALSSRNVYLSAEQRTQALALSRGLRRAAAAHAVGERSAERLRGLVLDELVAQTEASVDYVSLADTGTLQEAAGTLTGAALLSLAVRFGTTRLIDNVILTP